MTPARKRRRSAAVDLALLGTAGSLATLLAGCTSQTGTFHRNVYRSIEDCASDYARAVCVSEGQQRGGNFVGPVYRMVGLVPNACRSDDKGVGRAFGSKKIFVESVIRGGLGTSCPSSSSGRSWSRSSWAGG